MHWQPSNSVETADEDHSCFQSSSMVDEPWVWTWDLDIPSKAAAIRKVHEEVVLRLRDQQWSESDIFGICLALEEALVNAVKHGNGNDAAKRVLVRCCLGDALFRAEIEDQGKGFDPALIPDPTSQIRMTIPNGRGVMLMRNFMSRVAFNKIGNRVILEKQRGE